jgi:hypothetical protein
MPLETTGLHQDFAQGDHLGMVHLEHVDRRPTDGLAADQRAAQEAEVIVPFVPSREIEPRGIAGQRVEPGQVRPLVGVAVNAG